jgi:hypothetical protein
VTVKAVLEGFPAKRIEAEDGMAVTAAVWQEAHAYHQAQLRYHTRLSHGAGIVTGLEVIASDPPDSAVYILPGIAVDPEGRTIVLPEPMAYDLGASRGTLYLLLSYGESRPKSDGGEQGDPLYVHAQYAIEATSTMPETPAVELARVRRLDRETPIQNAPDRDHPAENQIDLRYRRQVGAQQRAAVTLGVCYAGGQESRRHGRGATRFARALRHGGQLVWVDNGIALDEGLAAYDLLYLVGGEAFQLTSDEANALYAYLQAGGTVFFESCRHRAEGDAPPADASFQDLLASMGVELKELTADHELLVEPHLFAAPPPGFETQGPPQVLAGGGVIFSTCDYGCLWRGERREGLASREEIRSAVEWGGNLVAYAARRRGAARAQGTKA